MLKNILVLLALVLLGTPSAKCEDFQSQNILVVDDENGDVLLEKNSNELTSIASLTKLMTAMVVIDSHPNLQESIRIERIDVDQIKRSRSRVPVGETFTRQELLQLALMSSDNRAAAALARTYPGGIAAFKLAVNRKLKSLNMAKTVIEEPTGLSTNNVSTASDLIKMATAAAKYEMIREITTDSSDEFEIRGRAKNFHNTNRLIGQRGWNILLSKTGFTNEAGNCLIMKIQFAKRTATLVILNARAKSVRLRDILKIRKLLG